MQIWPANVTSSRMPVSLKIFGEARRKCTGYIALLRGKKVRETRGIETLVTLLLSKDTEYHRSKKTH